MTNAHGSIIDLKGISYRDYFEYKKYKLSLNGIDNIIEHRLQVVQPNKNFFIILRNEIHTDNNVFYEESRKRDRIVLKNKTFHKSHVIILQLK